MDAQAWVAVIHLPGALNSVCGLVGVQGPVEVPTPQPPGRCCPPLPGFISSPHAEVCSTGAASLLSAA